MISMILWILAGLACITVAAFGIDWLSGKDTRFIGFQFIGFLACIGLIVVGILFICMPWIENSSQDATLNMQACKHIGGSYEVIDQTWNGKYYTNVYGCIKK